jgi:gliding motility-associated-like protein/uncharacterized repeat protein (TIGR01451 family)
MQWFTCLGGGYGDNGRAVEPTSDGGYIVAGYTDGPGGDVTGFHNPYYTVDFWVAKLDFLGDIQWAKCLGGSGSEEAWTVRQMKDGGFIVAGETNSTDGDVTGVPRGGTDVWVVKLNSAGDIQWQKRYGGSGNDHVYAMQVTPDGGVIMAGDAESGGGDVKNYKGATDFWVLKLDVSGNLQWASAFGGSLDEVANSVDVTTDGGFIITGYTLSADGDVTSNHSSNERAEDIWVIKLDATGRLLWQKCLGGLGRDIGYAVRATPDGGAAVTGSTTSIDGDVTGDHILAGTPSVDCWVVKLSQVGAIEWQKCYGGSRTDIGYSIDRTTDGGFVVAGTTASTDGDVSCVVGEEDYWVLKIDAFGRLLWQKSIGGRGSEEAYSIRTTADGGCIVNGTTGSTDVRGYHPNLGTVNGDFLVVKLGNTAITGTPYIAINAPPAICNGSTLTLQLERSFNFDLGVNFQIQWTRNGVPVGGDSATYTASDWKDGDLVSCSVQGSDGCIPYTANAIPLVIHVPSASAAPPSVSITADAITGCIGNTLTFTATVTNPGNNPGYNWFVDDQPAGTNSPVFSSNTLQNGDWVQCLYVDNTVCATSSNNSNKITVQLSAVSKPSIEISASGAVACEGATVDFTAAALNGGPSPGYQWYLNGAPAGANSAAYSNSGLHTGDVVTCVLTGSAVCTIPATALSNSITMQVTPSVASSIRIGAEPAVLCSGKEMSFTAFATNGGPAPVYEWMVNGVRVPSSGIGGTGENFVSTSLSDGDQVSCRLTDSLACIIPSTDQMALSIHPSPKVDSGKAISLLAGQSVLLDLSPSGDIVFYSWSPTTGLSDPAIAEPTASPAGTIRYTLTVTSSAGCMASGDITLDVITKLAIPTGFTPNGDGHNDIFYVKGGPLGSKIKDLAVFNRWGQKIFQVHDVDSDDPRFGWDGTVNGKRAQEGSYVYQLVMRLADGTEPVYRGTVVLVR